MSMRTPDSKPTITVQLERDHHARLVDLAKATDRPLGYIVRLAVTAFLASPAALDALLQSAAVLKGSPQANAAPSQAPTPIRRPKASPALPVAPEPQPYDPAHPVVTLRTPAPKGKP